ncbi:SDR family NAD(P)-dependent oxidoreductase [Streptomyces sp. ZEA17I]|uniref:SDR family NAD(P)-dependent oxidoreductase n=1 Tax=Streptomyces sp. ZEA17I TaxID=2202516 RepID=UPI00215A33EB|nr:SDR family NAD(P)-dependent oxidoreductase [Streptomyces sp. ZEA17I]
MSGEDMPQTPDDSRVWFVTGASRGLGRAFAEAALDAGDRVVATARDVSALDPLIDRHEGRLAALSLDVTRRDEVMATVARAVELFGRLDVVVSNAGQLLYGMVEETTEAQARAHLDVNFFGALWVAQAVTPVLRAQGAGHFLQVSVAGAGGGSASTGLYSAGKAAVSALGEALAEEVEPFGIKVTLLEPGEYDTGLGELGTTATEELDVYDEARAGMTESWSEAGEPAADPARAAAVVLELSRMVSPPRHVVLGGTAYDDALGDLRERIEARTSWAGLSHRAG